MATVKAEELRAKTADELKDQLVDLKKEQFNLRFQTAGGQNENPARARIVRREIARIKTVLGEKSKPAAAAQRATRPGSSCSASTTSRRSCSCRSCEAVRIGPAQLEGAPRSMSRSHSRRPLCSEKEF